MALAPNIAANNIDYVLQQIKLNNTQLKVLNAEIEAQTADIKSSNNLSDPTIDGAYLFGVLYWAYNYIAGLSRSSIELFKLLPYAFTLLVLIMVSLRRRKEDQPPSSLGLPYFREER